jgi:hypothetical protein
MLLNSLLLPTARGQRFGLACNTTSHRLLRAEILYDCTLKCLDGQGVLGGGCGWGQSMRARLSTV